MREQETGGQRCFCVLAAHAHNGAAGAVRVVVDCANDVFLKLGQRELLTDKLPFGNETGLLDKREWERSGLGR